MATEQAPSTESLPTNVDIHQAASLMEGLNLDATDETPPVNPNASDAPPPEPRPEPGDDNVDLGDADRDNAADEGADIPDNEEQPEQAASDPSLNEPPPFWTAEEKAAWPSVPMALRAQLKAIDQRRNAYAEQKAQEAAKVRQEAMDHAKQATSLVEEGAKWWQANGPQFFKAFGDKWAGVDWNTLASENPAEWARLKQMRDNEAAMLHEANQRGQRDIAEANKRAAAQFEEVRRGEHEKLAAKLPEFFGTPEKATKTYKDLSQFLFDAGIPAERISAVHEAPIIEIALDAMRYRQGKKQASVVLNPSAPKIPAVRTPLRVAPGPAEAAGNQEGQRARQARERIRSGRTVDDPSVAAALINSLRL